MNILSTTFPMTTTILYMTSPPTVTSVQPEPEHTGLISWPPILAADGHQSPGRQPYFEHITYGITKT